MKKFALLLLVFTLLLSLAACAAHGGAASQETGSTAAETTAPTAAETAAPTQATSQTDTEPPTDTGEDLPEPEPVDETAPTESSGPAESTGPAEPTAPACPELAGSEWRAESIRDEKWVGRALSLYADGSLYYREGRMFSEYALYLDGLWRTEEDGTLDLTLWYSPYDGWDRPDDYRVTAADVPADCWYVRFSWEFIRENHLALTQETEQGFVDDEETRWIEFHAPEDMPLINLQELEALMARDDEELARLRETQGDWELFGYGGWTRFRGVARAGSVCAANVEYTVPVTISEAELAQAAQTGRITLQGQEYVYTTSPEEAARYGYESFNDNGVLLKVREDGQIGGGGYWVLRAGDRYYFVYEIGGVSSRIEHVEEHCWAMLDPETPISIGPGAHENGPATLDEYGSIAASAICYPCWDRETDEFLVYIDTR